MKASHLFGLMLVMTHLSLLSSVGHGETAEAQFSAMQTSLSLDPNTQATFRSGWQAAAVGDLTGLDQAINTLKVSDPLTPVLPYLEFERLRQSVDEVDEETITQFMARHRDWSFASRLESQWLHSLARRQQIPVVRRYLAQTGQQPTSAELRCRLASAQVANAPAKNSASYQSLMADIETLWRVGYSQDRTCDRAFRWWRSQGMPSHEVAWSRFELAIKQGERRLAGYLQRYLSEADRTWAARWLLMARYPHRGLAQARDWPDHPRARTIVEWGLVTLVRRDGETARGHWANLKPRFQWSERKQATIARELALFQAVSLDIAAVERIDELPQWAQDEQILGWRARVAMAHGVWEEVLASIQAMPATAQLEDRWRYWRGRALAEMGRPDAVLAYASISGEATYYGFLSAKKLGQPLSLCPETLMADPSIQDELLSDPRLKRALALFQVGLMNDARWTWQRWLDHLTENQQHQAALLAANMGWHDRAIATLATTGMRRAYALRFPLEHQSLISEHSERHNVDRALVYGLMRAESALQADARSPAGAMGLLQLMPATARAVARRHGIEFTESQALYEPVTNVALGVAHLAELSARFDGDWRLVAAAYNAGPNALERWLSRDHLSADLAPDVWIETLPFYETRDYIPRVLAFATIYEWQLGRAPQVLTQTIDPQRSMPGAPTSFVCAMP